MSIFQAKCGLNVVSGVDLIEYNLEALRGSMTAEVRAQVAKDCDVLIKRVPSVVLAEWLECYLQKLGFPVKRITL